MSRNGLRLEYFIEARATATVPPRADALLRCFCQCWLIIRGRRSRQGEEISCLTLR